MFACRVVCQTWDATRHKLLKHEYNMNYKTCLDFKHEHDALNIHVTRDMTRVTRKFNLCYTTTRVTRYDMLNTIKHG